MFSVFKKKVGEPTIQFLVDGLRARMDMGDQLLSALHIKHTPRSRVEAGIFQVFQSAKALEMATTDKEIRATIMGRVHKSFLQEFASAAAANGWTPQELQSLSEKRLQTYTSIIAGHSEDEFPQKLAEAAWSALADKHPNANKINSLILFMLKTPIDTAKVLKSYL
jgi:hypothetical protein